MNLLRRLASVRTVGKQTQCLHNESSKLIKSDLGTGVLFFRMRQVIKDFAPTSKGVAINCKFFVAVIDG